MTAGEENVVDVLSENVADDRVAQFVRQEQEVLARLSMMASARSDRILQILGPDGSIAWASAEQAHPILCMTDVSLRALPGKLRLVRFGAGNDPAEGQWLQVAALLIDTLARRAEEMGGLIEEHIALTDQLLALYTVAKGTRAHWDLDAQLRVVLQEAVHVTGMNAGILIVSGNNPRALCEPHDGGLAAFAKALLLMGIDDVKEIDDLGALLAHPGIAGRYHRGAMARLSAGGTQEGGIVLLSAEQDRPILARDIKLAQAMADLAGTFVETASLHQMAVQSLKLAKELEIARDIQRLLMPEILEAGDNQDFAAFYRPAREVGGDFYMLDTLPDGRLVIALGDVVGKGVPAALLMSMTRTALLSLTQGNASPSSILRRTGRVLYPDLDRTGKFVTLCLAMYDPERSILTVANAGHSPVYLAAAGQPLLRLDPTGPPLGVDESMETRDQIFVFRPGDLFVITSDGFTEARNAAGEFFGLERFEGVLEGAGDRSPHDLCDRLVTEVMRFSSGAPQSDDQTAVVLRGRRWEGSTHALG
jgi:sigma-B regulation protein RsbU (phosphoserine phosphatase)